MQLLDSRQAYRQINFPKNSQWLPIGRNHPFRDPLQARLQPDAIHESFVHQSDRRPSIHQNLDRQTVNWTRRVHCSAASRAVASQRRCPGVSTFSRATRLSQGRLWKRGWRLTRGASHQKFPGCWDWRFGQFRLKCPGLPQAQQVTWRNLRGGGCWWACVARWSVRFLTRLTTHSRAAVFRCSKAVIASSPPAASESWATACTFVADVLPSAS